MSAPGPVVIGVDGSEHSADALQWGLEFAKHRRAPVKVVHTMDVPVAAGIRDRLPEGLLGAVREEGWKVVDRAASLAAGFDTGDEITTEAVTGPAAATLIEQSAGASAVIVGARGRGAVASALLGSVSSQLARHARCPVAVVRTSGHGARTPGSGPVVVGVDGTSSSAPAVAEAFREASLRGARLIAVHAWSDHPVSGQPVSGQPHDGAAHDGAAHGYDEQTARAVLSERLAGYAAEYPQVRVTHSVAMDRPAQAILHAARPAQLIVVGTRGRGGIADLMLGSTAQKVLRGAHLPVLVAR